MNPAAGLLFCSLLVGQAAATEVPLTQPWDYARAMRTVVASGKGLPGVVIHVGDSITYANPYGQWARMGKGRSEDDLATLKWMHTGDDNETDGWWLARFDHPDGNRSHTAASGMRADELLAGGHSNLPSLQSILEKYRPQAVVLMIGTNDVSANRTLGTYRADLERCVGLILAAGAVPVVSTIPPHPGRQALGRSYNESIRDIARQRSLPLIDFEREILKRRPKDWNGTLLGANDVHPTIARAGVEPISEPTAANLRESGYLLRGWLSVKKLAELRRTVFGGVTLAAAAPAPAPMPALPSPAPVGATSEKGGGLRVPVARDTWFSNVGEEGVGNNGGASQLKVKSFQEMSLVDIDPATLRGRVVTSAALHVRLAGEPILKRVTVSTFAAPWVEGTGRSYAAEAGSSSFRKSKNPDTPWTVDGGDLCSVMLGQGGTSWRMADASPPDAERWQVIPVDPKIVMARVAGVSQGFLLYDDVGTEWSRSGEKFTPMHMPNRFVYSREQGANGAPYFIVMLGAEDRSPPSAPADIRVDTEGLPPGEARVSWVAATDQGAAGVAGFFVTVDGRPAPQTLVPRVPEGVESTRVTMHLRDLGLAAGGSVAFKVRAVDGAGNIGPETAATVQLSGRTPAPLPGKNPELFRDVEEAEIRSVAVVDELDKVQPVTLRWLPEQSPGYLSANHLWSSREGKVRLHAARNEFVAFQIIVSSRVGVTPSLRFEGPAASRVKTEFGRYALVMSKQGPLPDPIVPLGGTDDTGVTDATATVQSLHAEIYVPHDTPPGEHRGKLTLSTAQGSLSLDVSLKVWGFTLPDVLSFLPEMNCYGLPGGELAYYRLAHRHRTVLNRVPYSQGGSVAEGCAPRWDGRQFDWAAWDRRFAPLFDGSAFAGLPRDRVPIEAFYLPLHENWPTPMASNYNGDYWADRAFKQGYRQAFVEASRQFTDHAEKKGWSGTFFQCFLNNKVDFKRDGWSKGSSPWLLDEPAGFQDFWALRYFATAFHEGVRKALPIRAKMAFRADISRPQWQRDSLDGLLDYNVVSGVMREYPRIVFGRQQAEKQILIEYGSTNPVEESNVQPAAWCLDAWTLGVDGVLPWQTVGNANSWVEADTLSVLYPGRRGGAPVPSVRLKAYRRGQQDVEYLTLLSQATKEPRWAVAARVRETLKLAGHRGASGSAATEDAGLIRFESLRPQDLWALRVRVGEALSTLQLPTRRQLVELRTPPREPARLGERMVSGSGR